MDGPAHEELDGASPMKANEKLAGSSEDEMETFAAEVLSARDAPPVAEVEHAPRLFRHSIELIEQVGARRILPPQDARAAAFPPGAAAATQLRCSVPRLWELRQWMP